MDIPTREEPYESVVSPVSSGIAVVGRASWLITDVPRLASGAQGRGDDSLLYEGLDAAELFTRDWEHTAGRAFHRWADIATIIGLLDNEIEGP